MPQVIFKCPWTLEGSATPADCIAHAQTEGSAGLIRLGCPYTAAILSGYAKTMEDETMPEGAIRVTQLLGCARRAQYRATVDHAMDIDAVHALWRGQIIHELIERYHGSEVVLSEKRLNASLDGITITGKPDVVTDGGSHLDDYKTTNRIPSEPYDHHIAQVNVYAWLLRQNKYAPVKTAAIVYLSFKTVKHLGVPVWSNKQTTAFLRERIQCWKGSTPTPSRWECASCSVPDCSARIAIPRRKANREN